MDKPSVTLKAAQAEQQKTKNDRMGGLRATLGISWNKQNVLRSVRDIEIPGLSPASVGHGYHRTNQSALHFDNTTRYKDGRCCESVLEKLVLSK